MTEPAASPYVATGSIDPILLELVRGQARTDATLTNIAARIESASDRSVDHSARIDALERRWDRALGVVLGVGIGAGAVGGGVGALVSSLLGAG